MMSCELCTKGYILPGDPSGSMVDGHYYRPAPKSSSKTSAIIVLTDIFGVALKNPKIIADRLAQEVDCDVWVPDLFNGEPPFTLHELRPILPDTGMPNDTMTLWRRIKLVLLGLSRAFRLYGSRPAVVDARTIEFIQRAKKEKNYEHIGAVGYCFGGALGVRLGETCLLDSLVICHPTIESTDGIKALKCPTSFVCAEADMSFTPELRAQSEAVLAARLGKPEYIDYEFKEYKGTVHGFATRPNLSVPLVVEGYEGALKQTADWFNKTL